jgi:hypothetical protein
MLIAIVRNEIPLAGRMSAKRHGLPVMSDWTPASTVRP